MEKTIGKQKAEVEALEALAKKAHAEALRAQKACSKVWAVAVKAHNKYQKALVEYNVRRYPELA